jgi:hypothetical protein
MTDKDFRNLLNGLVFEDVHAHISTLKSIDQKASFLMKFEDQYIDYLNDIIGLLHDDPDDPNFKQDMLNFLSTCCEDDLDHLIKNRIARKNLVDFLVAETNSQERTTVLQRQSEIIRLTSKMFKTEEQTNLRINNLRIIPQKNLRIRKTGEFQQDTGRMVIKDPSFSKDIKSEDLVRVKPGKWDVYLIETNRGSEQGHVIGCLLKHEHNKDEIFPTLLDRYWETLILQQSTLTGVLSAVDENHFNQELTEEQLKQFDCPFDQVTNWYDWCSKILGHKNFEEIPGGCIVQSAEFRNCYNVLCLAGAKAQHALLGIEFTYKPRVFKPIFNCHVYQGERNAPF